MAEISEIVVLTGSLIFGAEDEGYESIEEVVKTFDTPEWILKSQDVSAYRSFVLECVAYFSQAMNAGVDAVVEKMEESDPGGVVDIERDVQGLEDLYAAPDSPEGLT